MKRKSLLFMLLFALLAPWAANAQCTISYQLTDSYGDGWNGGALVVTDATTSTQLANLTISSGSSATGTIPVTDGHQISFAYTTGSYAYENSWVITDAAGTVIWQGSGDDGSQSYSYTAECPSCFPPTNLTCTGTTTTSATLTWVAGNDETAWVLEYGTAADFTGATQVNSSNTSITLNNLTSGTTYHVRAKSNCGNREESAWSQPVSFTTKQVAIAVGQGWSDDFEGTNNWAMVNGGNNAWVIGTAVNNGGSQALYISNDGGTTNAYTTSGVNMVYATKLMTFETGQYIFTYDWQAYGEGSYDYIRAWLAPATATFTANQLPDGTTSTYYYTSSTPTGWIALDGGSKLNLQSSWQNKSVTVDVTAGDYLVVFMWGNDSSGGSQPPAAIDNFEITKVMCAAPSAFAASNVMGRKATLNWTSDGSAWQVAYTNDATIDPDNLTPDAATTNSYQLTGLTPETPYYAYVRTDCGGTYSAWVSTTFTTTVACPAPTSLACTALTATTATLSWTETGEASDWVVEYGTAQDFTGATSVNVSTTASINLTGLTAETVYYARVKADCGGGDASAWSATASFEPTNKTVIGTAATTNQNVPTTVLYNYSLTQQIYTAAELGGANAILSIDFYCGSNGTKTRDFNIYMVSTNKSSFASTTDWITVTANDLVFSATGYTWHQGWNTFELDNPFIYDGTSNVAIIFDDNAGQWESSYNFAAFEATEQALRVYNDDIDYDPMSPPTSYGSSEYASVLSVKNHIRLLKGEAPSCLKPAGLTVNYTGGTTAEVSWVSNATAWNMILDGRPVNGTITNPYPLTNLELGRTYTVSVQAVCGNNETSEWTDDYSFTTDECMPEDKIVVNYELTDSWGDGWNNNGIIVVNDETCDIIEILTIESGSSNSGTLSLCSSSVSFYWYKGNYPGEASWVFTDTQGNELFSGTGNTSMETLDLLYAINMNPYATPTDIDVSEVGNHSATVSWTENGNATAWEIMLNDDETNLIPANTNPFTLTDLDPETVYDVNVRAVGSNGTSLWPCVYAEFTTLEACPVPSDLTATRVTATSATLNWEGLGSEYNVRYGILTHGDVLESINFDDSSMGGWTSIDADGDDFEWVLATASAGVYHNSGVDLTGLGHEESTDFVTSGSYSNYTGNALNPDNYLVSPLVTLGGSITFWAQAQDASFAAEHFGVAVSTTGNTDADDFTTIWETTLGAKGGNNSDYAVKKVKSGARCLTTRSGNRAQGNWYQFYVDLSEYSGQGYVAIRHFGCSDQFTINVDDIVIEGPAQMQWTNIVANDNSVEITGLEAETEYTWQVQANCGAEDGSSEWSMISTFTTGDFCETPHELEAIDITSDAATLTWAGSQDSYNLRYRQTGEVDPTAPATIILEAHDVWSDGSGYQMLLDADAEAYGTMWNSNHYILVDGEQYSTGDLPSTYFDEFEYKIPANADGALSTTNVVADGIVTITIPAGTYDYAIFNPSPDYDQFYIASDNGEVGGAEDDFVFEAGKTYHFTMGMYGEHDGAALEITAPMSTWTTVEGVTDPYPLTDLTPNTYYEWQVQGVNADCGELDWTEIQNFTTPKKTAMTQTVELTAGFNWFSLYVDGDPIEMLETLQEALNDHGVSIEGPEGINYNLGDGFWWGDLDEVGISNQVMYLIEVDEDCTIEFEGMPCNLSTTGINIEPGYNWIAFPSAVEVEINAALAGFRAGDNDAIEGFDGIIYNLGDSFWWGDFETFVPGQGYVYYYTGEQTQTLYFQTGAKNVRNANLNDVLPSAKKVLNTKMKLVLPNTKKVRNANLKLALQYKQHNEK